MHGRQLYVRSEIMELVEKEKFTGESFSETLMRLLKLEPKTHYENRTGRPPLFVLPTLSVGERVLLKTNEVAKLSAIHAAIRRARERGAYHSVSRIGEHWSISRYK